jgi:hypothetical protein
MFHGDEEMKFAMALQGLERAFGITPTDGPSYKDYVETVQQGPTEREKEILRLLEVCERRLIEAKPLFEMRGYLTVGKLLDGLYHVLEQRMMPLDEIEKRARLVLDKIGEKIRSAPQT